MIIARSTRLLSWNELIDLVKNSHQSIEQYYNHDQDHQVIRWKQADYQIKLLRKDNLACLKVWQDERLEVFYYRDGNCYSRYFDTTHINISTFEQYKANQQLEQFLQLI